MRTNAAARAAALLVLCNAKKSECEAPDTVTASEELLPSSVSV